MDRGNQINGTLSLESLAALKLPSLEAQSIKDTLKKHHIELLDFSLVVTYSTPAPEVHLHVEQLQVDWGKGLIKCAPSKKLQKLGHISSLLAHAYQTAKSSQALGSSEAKSPTRALSSSHDLNPPSNVPPQAPLGQDLSQNFASQFAVHDHESLERSSNAADARLRASADLLQHLGKSSSLESNRPPHHGLQQPHSRASAINSNENQSIYRQYSPLQSLNEGHRESSISSQPRNDSVLGGPDAISTQPSNIVADLANFETQPQSKPFIQPLGEHNASDDLSSKKRQRESSATANRPGDDEPSIDFPARKKQRAVENDAGVSSTPIHGITSARVNPWAGLIEIATNEVMIENDQAELLENAKMLWIPPNPGQQMPQGHVPPSLLRKWNNIAERRHHLADAQEIPSPIDSPITPTQDTNETSDPTRRQTTPSDWGSPTPPRQNRLPDSSPIKQPGLASRDSSRSRSPIERGPVQKTRLGSTDDDYATQEVSQLNWDTTAHISNNSDVLPTQTSLVPERETPQRDFSISSNQGQYKQPPESDAALDNTDILHPSISQLSQDDLALNRESPSQFTNPESPGREEDDSDDESIMDTSVPVALGETLPDPTQSSQAEQDITSSGSSLPGVNREHVQVIETPMVGNNGPHQGKSIQDPSQSSYQAHKSSSQSRVLNTYPLYGSLDKGELSQETSHASGQSQEGQPLRVDVLGTQPQFPSTDSNSQSQSGLHHSQSDVVLDSSGPAQRREYFSQSDSSGLEPSSRDFTSSHQMSVSQANESTKASTRGNPSPCVNQSSARLTGPDQSPSKSPRHVSTGVDECSQTSIWLPPASMAMAAESANESEELSEAERAYKRFCRDYPIYTGDFNHFVELCSKLQAYRSQGQLESPSLWDDFIIVHIQRYLSHCQGRAAHDCPSYEVFFALNCSQPLYTKRSLTAREIDLGASQSGFGGPSLTTHPSNRPVTLGIQDQPTVASFTASLADEFTDLCTHSFDPLHQNEEAPDTHDQKDHVKMDTSRSPSVEIKQEGTQSDSEEALQIPSHSTGLFEETFPSVESTMDQEVDQKFDPSIYDLDRARNDANMDMLEVEETDIENTWHQSNDEESDAEEDPNHHRTASVELGDNTFVSTNAQSRASAASKEPVESDGEDDNWFSSFRYRQALARSSSTGGRWYDDPNTPFKAWAIADQNVLSERYRRGRAFILVNERGEIRRPIHR